MPEDQKAFAEAQGFPYPLLSDADQEVGRLYLARRPDDDPLAQHNIPRRISYLIDPEGRIARTYNLDDHQGLDQHAANVLADIKELSAKT